VCLAQLALNSGLIEKLRDEMDQTNLLSIDKEMDYKKLSQLPFLNAIYNETLRFDSSKAIPRYAHDEIKCGEINVPARTTIVVDLEGMHRSKLFGENPEKFNPMRFLSDSGKSLKINEYPFVPFSTGARRCPAMPTTPRIFKLILTVKNFELLPTQDSNATLTFVPVASKVKQQALRKA